MKISRAAAVLASTTLIGVALGLFARLRPDEIGSMRAWLNGGRARPRPLAPATAPIGAPAAQDTGALDASRTLVREGRAKDALANVRGLLASRAGAAAPLLRIEEAALTLVAGRPANEIKLEFGALDPKDARAADTSAADTAGLLAAAPRGLGLPGDPGQAHARAFVAAALVAGGGSRAPHQVARPLVSVIAGDAETLVDVLSAWTTLPTVGVTPTSTRRGHVSRAVGVQLCQAVLDDDRNVPALARDLAAIADADARPAADRALAAMALAEIADLPVGLGLDLPLASDDLDAYPTDRTTAAWRRVTGRAPVRAFRERLTIALESLGGDLTAARRGATSVWLWNHVGERFDQRAAFEAARRITDGEVAPAAHLAALAARGSAGTLSVMEDRPDLRLPLHHLLTLTNAAGSNTPPRWAASSPADGVVTAWRIALGQDDVPFTLRVAHVSRRLDGLTILDHAVRTLRAGTPVELRWSEDVVEALRGSFDWTPPGATTLGTVRAHMTERLRVRLLWSDDGAELVLETLDADVERPGSSGSSGESGATWPAAVPAARGGWGDADSPASRRAFLIVATPGTQPGAAWTLDDWRRAAVASFDRLQRRAGAGGPGNRWSPALRALGDALALLRPDFDANRLVQLTLDAHGLGPGVARALALAGKRVMAVESDVGVLGGSPTRLSCRDVAELALDAPDPDERLAAGALLVYSKRPTPPIAEELLQIASRDEARVPSRVLKAAEESLVRTRLRRGTVHAVLAGILWAMTALLLLAALLRRGRPHGARVGAALLLIAALVIAQVDIFLGGTNLTPAWAGWALAALAAWQIGRRRARRQATVAAAAFGAAAVASLGAPATSIVAALAAITGCVALGPLAAALIAGIGTRRREGPPRRPVSGDGWRLALRVALPALAVGGLFAISLRTPLPQLVSGALHYAPIAFCFGGVLLWRMATARLNTAHVHPLPVPFVLGLVVPAVVLLVTTTAAPRAAAGSGDLGDPLDSMLRVAIFCALLFALVRLFDAARIRARADNAAAQPSPSA